MEVGWHMDKKVDRPLQQNLCLRANTITLRGENEPDPHEVRSLRTEVRGLRRADGRTDGRTHGRINPFRAQVP